MKFLKVSNIKLSIDEKEQKAFEKAIKIAGIHSDDVIEKKILKYSIDARKKPEINKIYTVLFKVENYNKTRKNVTVTDKEKKYDFAPTGTCSINKRPIIVGFGPAGMFCGYMLAKYGYKPIIIERGSRVDERIKKVNAFWNGEKLDTSCNVQFGEGGAGTFSDGKLNTGIKDKENRIGFVLNTFVKFGANPKIEYDAKPHIGTDVLSEVVKNMRHAIEDMGGTFYFDTTVSEILLKNGRVNGVKLSNEEVIDTDICLLAIGHSARDTFEMLNRLNITM
ncbi:MAG: NAD(P)/FAD-dependent oxidoreductase [Eubacterium sp.]